MVSNKVIHTDPRKIESVSQLFSPTNVEQIRTFLGLVGYNRKFIPSFASVSATLVNLTKKRSKFLWTNNHEAAFHSLRGLFIPPPILAYPQLEKPFILKTDASDIALGAVLTRLDDFNGEHVISYASRSLSNRGKAYSACEKEALAAFFTIDHFRPYLLSRKFTLVTDHSALRWLHSVEAKGRLARWVMDLQEFDFHVRHRPGSANGNADALSRLPVSGSSSTLLTDKLQGHLLNCATTVSPSTELQQAQLADPGKSTVIHLESDHQPQPPLFVWTNRPVLMALWHCWDDLHLVNGMLVKKAQNQHALSEYPFVIPAGLVDSVLQGIHSIPFAGHLGARRTILRARNKCSWPQMQTHIKTFIRNCHVVPKISKVPTMTKLLFSPFTLMSHSYSGLDMGPLPETSRGNKHLLVILAHFTKWCEAVPTKDQKASAVAEVLVSRVFSRFGPPAIIHSDQGRNLKNHLMHEIGDIVGIHKSSLLPTILNVMESWNGRIGLHNTCSLLLSLNIKMTGIIGPVLLFMLTTPVAIYQLGSAATKSYLVGMPEQL